ncbi:MAG: hypothetical protein ABL958_17265, partial [Bdellovibrionia bacterium]
MKHLTLLALPLIFLANCAPSNPKLQNPAREYGAVEVKVAEQNADLNSKIDILFVIDNSASMLQEQQKLSEAIDHFAAAFANNT